jgi:hypothetical protein
VRTTPLVIFVMLGGTATLSTVGIPAWVWFTVCAVAGVAGFALLATDRAQRTARNRERRRWAALRGWQFEETDHVLPTRWESGAIAYYGTGIARDVVAGSTFTADGRRQVYVLDHETNGKVNSVLVGVRCRRPLSVVIELWLPSATRCRICSGRSGRATRSSRSWPRPAS